MEILSLIVNSLELLKVTEQGQKRKNLRLVKRTRKQVYRLIKKDGISEEEQKQLYKLDNAIIESVIRLSKL